MPYYPLPDSVYHNRLFNGNMDIWQRNTSFTPNDDVYTADRWNALTETNGAWTIVRDTDAPDGSFYSMKFTNVTLNNQVGIVQILETKDTIPLDDKTVSLSFWAKTSGTEIANLRAGIITWGSTADSVTSDVFSAWASDGTNPTLAANWTYENTPSNLPLTSTWTQYKIQGVLLDTATVNNVAVVIWTDDGTIAANDDFWVTQVQLNLGSVCAPFQPRTFAEELALCQRYYEKSYPYSDAPGSSYADLFYNAAHFRDNGGANAFITVNAVFETRKRNTPTLGWYNPVSGAGPTHARAGGSTGTNYTSLTVNLGFETHAVMGLTTNSGDFHLGACWTADAEL